VLADFFLKNFREGEGAECDEHCQNQPIFQIEFASFGGDTLFDFCHDHFGDAIRAAHFGNLDGITAARAIQFGDEAFAVLTFFRILLDDFRAPGTFPQI
jgi:hypothetical protein